MGVSLLAGGGYLGWQELESSRWQSQWLSRYAADLDYTVKPGPSPRIQFPEDGPFDRRLGYVDLPNFIERLVQRNFRIEEQARFSRALLDYTSRGFFPPYPEESQAGLTINDCRGLPLYTNSYPRQYYERFEDIPARGDEPAVHRGSWPARRQPAERQPGGGLAAVHQGCHQPVESAWASAAAHTWPLRWRSIVTPRGAHR